MKPDYETGPVCPDCINSGRIVRTERTLGGYITWWRYCTCPAGEAKCAQDERERKMVVE